MIANPQTAREERIAVIRQFVAERLFHKPEEVTLQSRLIADLGADSLDFVDFQFQIEKPLRHRVRPRRLLRFVVPLGDAERRLPQKRGHRKSSAASCRDYRRHPDPEKVPIGELMNLITVETLLRIVEQKLAA